MKKDKKTEELPKLSVAAKAALGLGVLGAALAATDGKVQDGAVEQNAVEQCTIESVSDDTNQMTRAKKTCFTAKDIKGQDITLTFE